MKRLLLVLICIVSLFSWCNAQENGLGVGIDIISAFRKSICIDVEYSFSQKLSAYAEAALCIEQRKRMSETEEEHNKEFADNDDGLPAIRDWHKEKSGLNCWIREPFKGVFITAGISHGSYSGLDCYTGIGYMAELWKGLGLSIKYNMDIFRGLSESYPPAECIEIRLKYVF